MEAGGSLAALMVLNNIWRTYEIPGGPGVAQQAAPLQRARRGRGRRLPFLPEFRF